jgi:hypothetical protein
MVIYYSHSVDDYDTPKENQELQIIEEQNPGVAIINPKDIKIPPEERKYFRHILEKYIYPEIDKCSIIYYSRNKNRKITQGTHAEIQYGYHKKISVYPIMKMLSGDERERFYKRNPDLITELLNFFKLPGGGLRCIAIRPFDRGIKYVYRNNLSQYNYALQSLNKYNFVNTVRYARTIEFLPYIFDDGVLQNNRKQDIMDHAIGVTPIIDLDSYDIDILDKSKGRIDILSDQKYIDEMNNTIDIFRDELRSVDQKIKQNIFTGNGFNIIGEDYYDDDIKGIYAVVDGLNGIKQDVQEKTGCEVHLKRFGWNSNLKPPDTFHFDNHRLTLALRADKKLDLDWLVEHSDPFSGVYK